MTNEEALSHFRNHLYMTDFSWQDEMSEVAIKAIEKQIPKKPVGHWGEFSNIFYTCPTCDKKLPKTRKMYCIKCGQRIDWREGEKHE